MFTAEWKLIQTTPTLGSPRGRPHPGPDSPSHPQEMSAVDVDKCNQLRYLVRRRARTHPGPAPRFDFECVRYAQTTTSRRWLGNWMARGSPNPNSPTRAIRPGTALTARASFSFRVKMSPRRCGRSIFAQCARYRIATWGARFASQ